MTLLGESRRCRWCSREVERREGPGRPRLFCKPGCRQADYLARRRSAELGLSETELIITRQALEELQDRLYVLEAAVDDVDRDLQAANDEQDLRDALAWLLASARPLCGHHNLT